MAERNSSYERMDRDTYVTPQWVFDALLEVEKFPNGWFDAAPVDAQFDFLQMIEGEYAIVTNPPYFLAREFVEHALELTYDTQGKVAMLLPMAWDTAKGRTKLFAYPFKAKYTITRRIRWSNLEQRAAGPSMNHAWLVWDWSIDINRVPTMGWLPLTRG